MKKLIYLLVIISLPMLNGCGFGGEEIGRVTIDKLTTEDDIQSKKIELDLKNGDEISYWADMDIEYKGEIALEFQVMLTLDGNPLGVRPFDPFDKDRTIGEYKLTNLGNTKWKFSGRMKKFDISRDGKYEFEVILLSNGNESLKINKAAFVIKK